MSAVWSRRGWVWPMALSWLILFTPVEVLGASKGTHSPAVPRYQVALLMEAEMGQVLFAHEPHQPWPMASLTKMMLMLLMAERLKEGSLRLDDLVRVSRQASRIGGSQVYLREGEVFPLEELMKAIVIHSANDACVAVAEHVAGSAGGMVELMNHRAAALGMTNTRIRVPPDDPKYTLRRVWLSRDEEEGHYYGFSNQALWPLCHIVFSRPNFDQTHWDYYRKVNQKFAEVVLEEIEGVRISRKLLCGSPLTFSASECNFPKSKFLIRRDLYCARPEMKLLRASMRGIPSRDREGAVRN